VITGSGAPHHSQSLSLCAHTSRALASALPPARPPCHRGGRKRFAQCPLRATAREPSVAYRWLAPFRRSSPGVDARRVVARYQQRRSFERGDHIATALASYHQVSGFYPRTLSELVPHYLPTVPRSAMGVLQRVPFDYSCDVREGYSLAFAVPAWIICHRTARRAR